MTCNSYSGVISTT